MHAFAMGFLMAGPATSQCKARALRAAARLATHGTRFPSRICDTTPFCSRTTDMKLPAPRW